MAKAYCTSYFTGKVLRLLNDPQKPQKFSTVNDLQYTVCGQICKINHVHIQELPSFWLDWTDLLDSLINQALIATPIFLFTIHKVFSSVFYAL